jgi:hypothetical protein
MYNALFLERLITIFFALAGLLTYHRFEQPSRKHLLAFGDADRRLTFSGVLLSKRCIMIHSSGSVQDFHLIPSSSTILTI